MNMKNFLLWLWQLPQNLIGWGMKVYFMKVDKGKYRIHSNDGVLFMRTPSMPGGVSLGNYVFLRLRKWYRNSAYEVSEAHEYGHCKQSRMLGWLYLFVVGIPSALHNLWQRKHRDHDYYAWYCEAWADKLGGVKRNSDGDRYV